MLKIRLMRIGTKKKPFYRVVALDERSKRTGSYIENLGTYNPLSEPKEIKLNQARIDYWIKQGAQPSDGYLRIIGKAPQRPPRKPKKQKEETAASPTEQPKEETPAAEETAEQPQEEKTKTEETPITTTESIPSETTPAAETTETEPTPEREGESTQNKE